MKDRAKYYGFFLELEKTFMIVWSCYLHCLVWRRNVPSCESLIIKTKDPLQIMLLCRICKI